MGTMSDDDLAPEFPPAFDLAPARGRSLPAWEWTPEQEAEILEQISHGVPLVQISRQPGMPSPSTIIKHRKQDPAFDALYEQARLAAVDIIEGEILDIADDGRNDWEERERKNGDTYIALNTEAVQRSRLRIESRKYLLGVYSPKHRERTQQDVNLDARVLSANVNITDEQRKQRVLELLQGIAKRRNDQPR